MPSISVILPVYNAEDYVSSCINSVLSQSFGDFELIIVDDGSTDNSLKICRGFESRNSRIRVIHQDNMGVSMARNNAIEHSIGDYLTFIDADDTYTQEFLYKLHSAITKENSDICICDSYAISADGEKSIETFDTLGEGITLYKKDIKPEILLEIAGAVWRCMYKSSLIKNKLRFKEGLKIAEDRIFNIQAMGRSDKITYLKEPLYNRMILEGSTVHRFHKDYWSTIQDGKRATEKAIRESWENKIEFQNAYLQQFVYGAIMAIENIKRPEAQLNFRQKYKFIKEICNHQDLHVAIRITNFQERDVRARWIYNKNILFLMMKSMRPYWQYRRMRRALSFHTILKFFKK